MSRHSFDPEIANRVGLNAAVIYQNISWWCERNAAKGKNVEDGNAWTFNSIPSFQKLFPYLTAKQIRLALEKLVDGGLLEVGNFNKDNRDRTKWYALPKDSEAFAHLVRPHLPIRADTSAREGRPLPVSKPVNKHTPIVPKGTNLFSEQEQPEQSKEEAGFDEFWKAYPKKVGKPAAKKAWAKAISKTPAWTIIAAAEKYADWLANPKRGEFRPHPKHPQGWLNDDRWDQFVDASGNAAFRSEDELNDSARRFLQNGKVPPSMKDPNGEPTAEARHFLQLYGFGKAKA